MVMSAYAVVLYYIFVYVINIICSIEKIQLISTIIIGVIITYNVGISIKYKKINYKKIITSIIIIGIILRTTYILYTPITERQHDMEQYVGHLAYIETIFDSKKLPLHNEWQFYHQPLHHIISAIWLEVNANLGVNFNIAKEGIQILTAIYSSMIILITYCILKELNIEDKYKVLVMSIISFHPTMIILSGSINNDILMIMFTFLDILYLIKWNKNDSIKNTIILALLTAFTALTKISGTIIAIPIIYVFINKFLENYKIEKEKKEVIKKYIIKYILFGIIALGIGLSFSIRNMIMFGQSIFYVPTPSNIVYCGENSLFDRINIFSKEWLNSFCNPFEDCNIISFLIKSSLFGEYSTEKTLYEILARTMIIANVILVIISLATLLKILIKGIKTNKKEEFKIISILFISEIIMYLYSNFTMPYGCTMDFRYIVPTILTGMLFIVFNIEEESETYHRLVNSIVIINSILFIIFELTGMRSILL